MPKDIRRPDLLPRAVAAHISEGRKKGHLSTQEPSPPVLPEIMERRSGAAFDSRPIEREKIDALIEATRWAPSARNLQPWYVMFVQGEENHQAVLDALGQLVEETVE